MSWLEDLTQRDSESVGRKCANLGELTRAGFQVPPGFALSLGAYETFLETSGAGDEIERYLDGFDADPDEPKELSRFSEAAQAIRGIIEAKPMPDAIADELAACYDRLCERTGVEDVPVATRSAGPASHPGQYESYLNVSGHDAVMRRGQEGVVEHLQHAVAHRAGAQGTAAPVTIPSAWPCSPWSTPTRPG